jgi:WD40 repeat protein
MSTAARVSAPRRVPWALSSSGAALLLALTGAAVPSAAAAPHAPDIARASVATGGQQGNGTAEWPAISADGHSVAFTSAAGNLVPHDTNGVADIFVKDLRTGEVERVSRAADGGQADGASGPVQLGQGRIVFSSSAANLVPRDTNGVDDIFVRTVR